MHVENVLPVLEENWMEKKFSFHCGYKFTLRALAESKERISTVTHIRIQISDPGFQLKFMFKIK